MNYCKNCAHPLTDLFCAHCGQKSSTRQITLPHLLSDIPESIFHVDKGFLFNLFSLFKSPGKSISNYLEGKRKPFYHPASYLVIALLLNYLVVRIYNLHFYDEKELIGMDEFAVTALRNYDAMQWWFLEHTYIYILFAIVASTLFLYGVFRLLKQKYNIAETAVIMLFIIAQSVMIQTLFYTFFGWFKSGPFLRTIETINTTCLIIYSTVVVYQMLEHISTTWKRALISMVTGLVLVLIGVATGYSLYLLLTDH